MQNSIGMQFLEQAYSEAHPCLEARLEAWAFWAPGILLESAQGLEAQFCLS